MRRMKDSGISWIGEIPGSWKIVRTRFLCDIATGSKDTVDNIPEGKYPFYVRSPIVERIDTYSFDGEAVLMAGDGVGAGKVFHYVDEKFDYHQRVYCFSNFRRVLGKYFFYSMRENFKKEVEMGTAKSTVDSIRLPMIQDFWVALSDESEQQKISDYLDQKTSEIDDTINDYQAMVEKLNDYHRSVITEATTKGLDPNVRMKDSGIPWIGEIPEEWDILRLKNLASVKNGQGYIPSESDDEGYPVFGSGGQFAMTTEYMHDKPSVLLGRKGSIDNPQYVDCPFWASDTMYYTKIHETTCAKYLYYLAKTIHFDYYQYGSALPSMTQKDLVDIKFAVPRKNEQTQISEYLDKKTTEIDTHISDITNQIEKLKEYRQGVVFEAITGKIEV